MLGGGVLKVPAVARNSKAWFERIVGPGQTSMCTLLQTKIAGLASLTLGNLIKTTSERLAWKNVLYLDQHIRQDCESHLTLSHPSRPAETWSPETSLSTHPAEAKIKEYNSTS